MTKEEAKKEYMKLLAEKSIAVEKIIQAAKKQGRWEPGLDSNRDLFKGIDMEFNEKISRLFEMIDE